MFKLPNSSNAQPLFLRHGKERVSVMNFLWEEYGSRAECLPWREARGSFSKQP